MAAGPVHSVELLHFCAAIEECPETELPELAFSGRSNVGKSSLINLLTGRRKLAYTSKQPGKTQCFTYYQVNEGWNLVDMPGYGYAKVGGGERKKWAAAAKRYFREREQLRGVLQLIDFKVGPTADDIARVAELVELGHPMCLVLTKADKIPPSRREEQLVAHLRALGGGLPPATGVVVTSSAQKVGGGELWSWMEDVLGLSGRD